MNSPLWLRVPPALYETPISTASRNAVLNHQTNGVHAFCADLGLDFSGLRDGGEAAVAQLAHLLGVSSTTFDTGILRRVGKDFSIRGERILKSTLRRERIHICPACLADDVASSFHPPAASAYCRSHWLLDTIRCCPTHELELVEIPSNVGANKYDFAAQIGPQLPRLHQLPLKSAPRSEIGFQEYLLARLDQNAPPSGFLDELEFHAASRLCEMLGATMWFNESRKLESLTNRDWLTAGELGFSYARQGRSGIRMALSELQQSFAFSRSGNDGPQAVFGRFFKWLAYSCEDQSFTPVRDLLREHIVETMPVGAGEMLLGQVVERRRLHSIRTASLETGAHAKQLRKILWSLGCFRPEDKGRGDAWCLFEAERYSDLLEDIRDAMPLRVASEYLGAGRVHGRLLFDQGYIQPFVRKSAEHSINEHLFSKRELDGFLSRLLAGAADAQQGDVDGLVTLPAAAKRTNCSSMEIVDLVLNGQIETMRRLPGPLSFFSLLVDVGEVRSRVRGEYDGEVTARDACARIRTTDSAIRALIASGIFKTRTVTSPKNRCPVEVISLDAVEEFRRAYCTTVSISREWGVGWKRVERILAEHQVKPELPREKFSVAFYRRSDLAELEFK